LTGGGDIAPVTFTISPKVEMTPLSGVIGTEITVRGFGFDANKDISISYDDALVSEATTTAEGSFTARFKAPASKGGIHTISVKDPSGASMPLNFTMDSEPPPAPIPHSPEDKTRLTMFGGAVTVFEWTESKDPSGVKYEFQLSKTPDFAKPVISKSGMTDLFYTMTQKEALDIGTYYWRVRAIDGAGNEGPWCPAQELVVGVMPVWQFIVIIVGSLAVITGLVVWLIRRRMYSDF
jgi:hypothetical protein